MADITDRRAALDQACIDVSEPWSLDYWSKHLGVSPERVRHAVLVVGTLVKDVKGFVGK